NGFEDLVKGLYTSFYPDIKITPASGKTLTLSAEQLRQLSGVSGVRALSLVVEDKAVLENGDVHAIAYLKGVDENFKKVTGVAGKRERGTFELGTGDHPLAVLGAGVENNLGVEAERALIPLSVYLFRRGGTDYTADPMSSLSNETMATSGDFRIQQDFD